MRSPRTRAGVARDVTDARAGGVEREARRRSMARRARCGCVDTPGVFSRTRGAYCMLYKHIDARVVHDTRDARVDVDIPCILRTCDTYCTAVHGMCRMPTRVHDPHAGVSERPVVTARRRPRRASTPRRRRALGSGASIDLTRAGVASPRAGVASGRPHGSWIAFNSNSNVSTRRAQADGRSIARV